MDFVSPENVNVCRVLTEEFQAQNSVHSWKEDTLQLNLMLWHAWAVLQ